MFFSISVGIPFEFIVPPLLSTISHLMDETLLIASQTNVQACIMYTVLVANPGTGKSKSIGLFENSLEEIDEYLETEPDQVGLIRRKKFKI